MLDIKKKFKSFSKEEYKKKFYAWCENSTYQGVQNIRRTKRTSIKIIWIVSMLVSASLCFVTIVDLFNSYLSYGVLINMRLINSSPVDFPAVTVCNLNPLDRTRSQYYINNILSRNNLTYTNNVSNLDMSPTRILNLIKSSIVGDKSIDMETRKYFGFSLDSMIVTCYFNDIPCNTSDFIWRYDFDYGNCYTFNSGYDQNGNPVPIKQISEDGSDRSFKLELFLGDEWSQGIYMQQSGAHVVIHNQTITPLIQAEGNDLSTNYQTSIGISRTFISKLDYPYSNCIKNTKSPDSHSSILYKSVFNKLNMTTYRQKICLKLCLQEYIKKTCKCLDASLPIIDKTYPVCSTILTLDCVTDAKIKFSKDSDANKCLDCPLECDIVEYTLSQSKSRYPTNYYTNFLRYQTDIVSKFPPDTVVNDNYIQKNIILLNVYLSDLTDVYYYEVPGVTSDSIFGLLGGNLGLFLGISILSFGEIIEIILEFLMVFFHSDERQLESTLKF